MLIRPTAKELEEFGTPDFTIYNAYVFHTYFASLRSLLTRIVLNSGQFPANRFTAGMSSSTSVELNFKRSEMVILGTEYAG